MCVCDQCLECRLPEPPLSRYYYHFFFSLFIFYYIVVYISINVWFVFFLRSRGAFKNVSFSFHNHFGRSVSVHCSVDSLRRRYDDDHYIINIII